MARLEEVIRSRFQSCSIDIHLQFSSILIVEGPRCHKLPFQATLPDGLNGVLENQLLLQPGDDSTMLHVAGIVLALSVSLSAAAIVSFSKSTAAARWLMLLANGAAVLGAIEMMFGDSLDGLGNWSFLFACGSCGCGVVAVRNLDHHTIRWVHRFAIYAGYAATLAAMGIAGLWMYVRDFPAAAAAAVLIGVYVAGSLFMFLAKTLTVRTTRTTMPEYHASLAGDPRGWG